MPTATLTSKGQITIPIEVRRALGIEAGDRIDFFEIEKGKYGLRPRTGSIMDMKGCLAGFSLPVTNAEMNDLMHQHALELDEATKTGAPHVADGEAA